MSGGAPAGRSSSEVRAALTMIWTGEHRSARLLLGALEGEARRSGAVHDLPAILVAVALLEHRTARWPAALLAAEEALELVGDDPASGLAAQASVLAAMAEAVVGPATGCRSRSLSILRGPARSDPLARMGALSALGLLELGAGRPEDAACWLEMLGASERCPSRDHPGLSLWRADLVEAYVRAGRVDRAAAIVEQLERSAEETGAVRARAATVRSKALVVRCHDQAEELSAAALRYYEGEPWRFARARVQLALGERRSAAGERRGALSSLEEARQLFDSLPAPGWTALADAALGRLREATGGGQTENPVLTAVEAQVVMAAIMGGTPADIASALFVEEETVTRWLRSAGSKLGVTDFRQIADVSRVLDAVQRGTVAPPPSATVRRRRFRVELLGEFRVTVDDATVTPRGLMSLVVKRVALARSLPLEELIDELWPEAEASAARARFRTLLNRLRDSLGPLMMRDGPLVRLHPEVEVDAERFEAAVVQAERAHAAGDADAGRRALDALELYGGELLPSSRHLGFTVGARERLRRRYLSMVDLAAEHLAATGDLAAAVRLLEDAVEADPYDEGLYLHAARLLGAAGQRAQAEAVLRRAQLAMAELGLALSAEASEVARALRAAS